MTLLTLSSGLAILASLLPGADPAAWLLMVIATALLLSAAGRWPATSTLFCTAVIAVLINRQAASIWTYLNVGILMGVYLLLVDAQESFVSLDSLAEWAAEQPLTLAAVLVGVAAVGLAAALPLALPAAAIVVLATAGTAAAFCWAIPTESGKRDGGQVAR